MKDETRLFDIIYDLAWPTKRGKELLTGEIGSECRRMIIEICEERHWQLLKMEVALNHVSLRVAAWPADSAEEIVKTCKRRTASLYHIYKELHRVPTLWTRNYLARTIPADFASEEIIKPEELTQLLRMAKH